MNQQTLIQNLIQLLPSDTAKHKFSKKWNRLKDTGQAVKFLEHVHDILLTAVSARLNTPVALNPKHSDKFTETNLFPECKLTHKARCDTCKEDNYIDWTVVSKEKRKQLCCCKCGTQIDVYTAYSINRKNKEI
jgi:hypothetical protein